MSEANLTIPLVVLDEWSAFVPSEITHVKRSTTVGQSIVYLDNGTWWEILAPFDVVVEKLSGVRPNSKLAI